MTWMDEYEPPIEWRARELEDENKRLRAAIVKAYDSVGRLVISMNDLIEALRIFAKYTSRKYPTQCEHDLLIVCGVPVLEVSEEDKLRLAELGFTPGCELCDEMDGDEFIINEDSNMWVSNRFGSC